MKKIGVLAIGIVIGATLTISPQIYGAGTKLLGSKVDNTLDIKLNGKSIGQGAVINGTSYLPVRSAANALGLEVNVDSKQVDLQGKSSEELASIAQKEQSEMDKSEKVMALKSQIEIAKRNIEELTNGLEQAQKRVDAKKINYESVMNNPNASQEGKDLEAKTYELMKQSLENVKNSLSAEQQKLTDLEAQLAELQGK